MQLAQIRTFNTDPNVREIVGDVPTIRGFEVIFNNLVSVFMGFAGLALFFMFIWGGFNLLTSGGEAQKAETAKKTLTYAIGGTVLLALAFFFLKFIEVFTGAQITNFRIFIP